MATAMKIGTAMTALGMIGMISACASPGTMANRSNSTSAAGNPENVGLASRALAAMAAGVHRQRTADRARDTGHELRAMSMLAGAELGELGAGDAGFGIDQTILHTQRVQHVMHQHHGAAHPAVAHQQIGTEPDEMHRLVLRQIAQERLQVMQSGRDIEAVGLAAHTPAGVAG